VINQADFTIISVRLSSFFLSFNISALVISKLMTSKQSLADIKDWNRIASNYESIIDADDHIYQMFADVLWECLGNLHGLDVLDLGCGYGWLSQEFSNAGANVLGVDGSKTLLEIARSRYPEIEFYEHNLASGLPFTDKKYDRVIANMVLMDIPELDSLIASISKSLKPAGKFIFTLPHPCFFNYPRQLDETTGKLCKMIGRYLDAEIWRIKNFGGHNHYHRSLTYYFDILYRHNLAVSRLYEPPQFTQSSTLEQEWFNKIPIFILLEAILRE
jgi:SAM-dependent methyltransferase